MFKVSGTNPVRYFYRTRRKKGKFFKKITQKLYQAGYWESTLESGKGDTAGWFWEVTNWFGHSLTPHLVIPDHL